MRRNRLLVDALRDFFSDLAAGDPVAIAILLAMLGFLVILGLLGWWILWTRKREAQKHRERLYGKYKKGAAKSKPGRER